MMQKNILNEIHDNKWSTEKYITKYIHQNEFT